MFRFWGSALVRLSVCRWLNFARFYFIEARPCFNQLGVRFLVENKI